MAVGTFALVLSLAVGQGVDRAVLALFHQDDRLRKFSVRPDYRPCAQDVPEAEREPVGPMSQAKRERMRRRWCETGAGRRIRLTASASIVRR